MLRVICRWIACTPEAVQAGTDAAGVLAGWVAQPALNTLAIMPPASRAARAAGALSTCTRITCTRFSGARVPAASADCFSPAG